MSKAATTALRKMARNWAERIIAKVEEYARDPDNPSNNVTRLKGSTDYRMRVGDFRVIFSRTRRTMNVKLIRPRGSAYR